MRLLRCRGVLNIVHGTHDTVNRVCDHPDIEAVSFVGSNAAGKYIYERATAAGKRCQASTAMIMSCLFCTRHTQLQHGCKLRLRLRHVSHAL